MPPKIARFRLGRMAAVLDQLITDLLMLLPMTARLVLRLFIPNCGRSLDFVFEEQSADWLAHVFILK